MTGEALFRIPCEIRDAAWMRHEALVSDAIQVLETSEAGRSMGPMPAPISPPIDFTADPEVVRVVAEGERLAYGHLFNPAFATEISMIDSLPHQRIAVYEHMLTQPRLRFLMGDEPGAGKTIMAGLYIREMLARRLLRRILIAPPAGMTMRPRRIESRRKTRGDHTTILESAGEND
jgi:hypothetical protein